jgi:lipopolysaccharide export system protein LptA
VSRDDVSWLRLALLAWLVLAPAARAVEPAGESAAPRIAIGVAAFESAGPADAAQPDIATLLADRIGTHGVHRVVGPAQLGAKSVAEPTPQQIQSWAANAGVSTIAVGRATRIGGRESIDVRLRAGDSGGLLGTYVAEVASPDQLGPALDKLAGQIVDATAQWLTGDVAAAPGRPAAGARGRALRSRDDPFGMAGFKSDEPLSIRSDELEASVVGGVRRLVFQKGVRVVQADMRLESDRLEAFYPEKASQPERLLATGAVRVMQGTREARCDQATYHRSSDLLICEGHAELRDGDDRVAGEVIEFDLGAEKVVVRGGAEILFHPEPEEAEARGAATPGSARP